MRIDPSDRGAEPAPADTSPDAIIARISAGQVDDAAACLERRLSADPTDVWGHLVLGSILRLNGRADAAELHLLRAAALAPSGELAPLLQLVAHSVEGDEAATAALYLTRALELCNPGIGGLGAVRAATVSPRRQAPATVAVGLPVYSGGEMLAGAIAGILTQTFTDLELFVLDAGDDPATRTICEDFARSDERVRHVYTGEGLEYVSTGHFRRVMQLSTSPYYMWASYDDRHDPTFVERCVEVLQLEPDAGLVYAQTRLLDGDGQPLGIARDDIHTADPDPARRMLHVVQHLDMCNAWYGLYRRSVLDRLSALDAEVYRSFDNLMLAECALHGTIVRISQPLFTRRLTRPRPKGLEEGNADVIRSHGPALLRRGITLPMIRLGVAHLELAAAAPLPRARRAGLADELKRVLLERLGLRMRAELDRACVLVEQGITYQCWDGYTDGPPADDALTLLRRRALIGRLEEALVFFPEHAPLLRSLSRLRSGPDRRSSRSRRRR